VNRCSGGAGCCGIQRPRSSIVQWFDLFSKTHISYRWGNRMDCSRRSGSYPSGLNTVSVCLFLCTPRMTLISVSRWSGGGGPAAVPSIDPTPKCFFAPRDTARESGPNKAHKIFWATMLFLPQGPAVYGLPSTIGPPRSFTVTRREGGWSAVELGNVCGERDLSERSWVLGWEMDGRGLYIDR
jgi:hypothetical protein